MRILTTFFILTLIQNVNSQALVPYLKNDLYGYSDTLGNLVIQPEYEEAEFFDSLGLAFVKKNNKWGLINEKNETILPITSKSQKSFYKAYNNRNEFVKRDYGKDFLFYTKELYGINNKDNNIRFINLRNKNISEIFKADIFKKDFKYDLFCGKVNDTMYHLLDTNLTIILKSKTEIKILGFNIVTYINNDTSIVLNIKDLSKYYFPHVAVEKLVENNKIIFSNKNQFKGEPNYHDLRMGICELNGAILLDTFYNNLNWTGGNLLIANFNRDTSYSKIYKTNGKSLFREKFKEIEYIGTNKFIVKDKYNKVKLINKRGRNLLRETFDKLEWDEFNNLYYYNKNDQVGVYNLKNKYVTKVSGDDIYYDKVDEIYGFYRNSKRGYLDKNGGVIVDAIYDYVEIVSSKFKVKNNNLFGIIDEKGKLAFPIEYKEIKVRYLNDSAYYFLRKDKYFYCYDNNLNKVEKFYDTIPFVSIHPMHSEYETDGYSAFTKFGRKFESNAEYIFCDYTNSDSTYVCAVIKRDSVSYYFDEGKLLFTTLISNDPYIDAQYDLKQGLFVSHQDSLTAILNHKNQIVIPYSKQRIESIFPNYIVSHKAGKYYIYKPNGIPFFSLSFDSIKHMDKSFLVGWRTQGNINYQQKIAHLINIKGKFRIFEDVVAWESYKRAFAIAKIRIDGNYEYIVIDTNMNIVLKTKYEKLEHTKLSVGSNPKFQFYQNGLAGLIDIKGNIIFPPLYKSISPFIDDNIFIVTDSFNNCQVINKNNFTYDLDYFKFYLFGLKINDEMYLIYDSENATIFSFDGKINKKLKCLDLGFERSNFNFDYPDLITLRCGNKIYYMNRNNLIVYFDE